MKKNVLYVFSLILYVLLACSILSSRVAELNLVQVVPTPINGKALGKAKVTRTFSGDKMIFTDELGQHVYQLVEGDGWNSGYVISEVTDWTFNQNALKIEGFPTDLYVLSASRQPTNGEGVIVVDDTVEVDDQYLALYEEGMIDWLRETSEVTFSINFLPENGEIAAENEHIMLLDMTGVTLPFMERSARNLQNYKEDCLQYAISIYSLTEAESFLTMLPRAGVLGALILFPVFLWGISSRFLRGEKRTRGEKAALLFNGLLTAASLGGIYLLFQQIDLPSSLMPDSHILDVGYYLEEFTVIVDALKELGVRQDLVTLAAQAPVQAVQIFLIGLEVCLMIALLEWLAVYALSAWETGKRK